jgi:hypothetical protein
MPYITQENRKKIDPIIDQLSGVLSDDGDYNYAITRIMHIYIEKNSLKYKFLNAIIGIVECAKQEFYRVVAGSYEDKKINENGFISKIDRILSE